MGGLSIGIGARDLRYFPAGELIPADLEIGNLDELEDRLLTGHSRMRRVLLRLMPGRPLVCYYLHWSDESDLETLDELVAAGNIDEECFSGAVVGEAVGFTCPECKSSRRVIALEVVVTSLLFAHDGVDRTRKHGYQQVCPQCGHHWKASVLEFVDKE